MNWRAAHLTGAINGGKRRVFWLDGVLHVFAARDGHIVCDHRIECPRPVRKSGFRATHITTTINGPVSIRAKCWTCGGWWRVWSKYSTDRLAGLMPGESLPL